jgi:hypothetical protein
MKWVARTHARFTSSIRGGTIEPWSPHAASVARENIRLASRGSSSDWTARETISFGIRPLKIPGIAAHGAPWTAAVPPWTSGVHAAWTPSTGRFPVSASS